MDSTSTLWALAGIAIIFFLGILITRAIFSIPQMLRYQKGQVRLLAKIAEAQGVDKKILREIVYEAFDKWNDLEEIVAKEAKEAKAQNEHQKVSELV